MNIFIRKCFLISLGVVFAQQFTACQSSPEQRLEYLPLNIAALSPDTLAENTPLRIIGFSGGRQQRDGKLYYYEFLTVNQEADTIRVITPAITVPGTGDSDVTHTSPLQYDSQKNISAAYFRTLDSSAGRILQLLTLPEGDMLQIEKARPLIEGDIQEKILVSNPSLPSFNQPHYKTVIGVLHFKEIPW